MQVKDTVDLEDCFANFTEGDVGRDALEENV